MLAIGRSINPRTSPAAVNAQARQIALAAVDQTDDILTGVKTFAFVVTFLTVMSLGGF